MFVGVNFERALPRDHVPAAVHFRALPRSKLHHQSLAQRHVSRRFGKVKERRQTQRLQSPSSPT